MLGETVFNETTRVMAARGLSTNVLVISVGAALNGKIRFESSQSNYNLLFFLFSESTVRGFKMMRQNYFVYESWLGLLFSMIMYILSETVFNETTRVMAARGLSTNVLVISVGAALNGKIRFESSQSNYNLLFFLFSESTVRGFKMMRQNYFVYESWLGLLFSMIMYILSEHLQRPLG